MRVVLKRDPASNVVNFRSARFAGLASRSMTDPPERQISAGHSARPGSIGNHVEAVCAGQLPPAREGQQQRCDEQRQADSHSHHVDLIPIVKWDSISGRGECQGSRVAQPMICIIRSRANRLLLLKFGPALLGEGREHFAQVFAVQEGRVPGRHVLQTIVRGMVRHVIQDLL